MLLPRNSLQFGFSLMEVLISLIILSFGLLGLAKMEIAAFRYNRSAYFLSVADAQASAVLACLQVVRSPSSCEQDFNSTLAQLLPKGKCIIKRDKENYHVMIGWHEPQQRYKNKLCAHYFLDGFNCINFIGTLEKI